MEKKIFAAVIAAVAALIIYNGGWEIIKFLGDKVFAYPWNFAAIIRYLSFLYLHSLICSNTRARDIP